MIKDIYPNQITLVARQWSEWCENNSFGNLSNYLKGCKVINTNDLKGWDNRLLRHFRDATHNSCYSSLSVSLEFEALKKSIQNWPKILHFWIGDNDYYYSYWIRRFTRAKIVVNMFFSIEELKTRMPNKSHLSKADLITCSGNQQMQYLSQFVSREKLVYLPLCVDTKFFSPLENNYYSKNPILLQVGYNRRDFKLLREVYKKLKSHIPNLSLEMVVGNTNVEKVFNGLGGINYHPFLLKNDLKEIYQKASMLILPLKEGGSSQALNEALACGLPVVTNDFPFLMDYTDSDAIITCKPGNVNDMVSSCLDILQNEKHRKHLGQKAREHALQFDYTNIYDKLLDIYREKLGFNVLLEN